MTFQRAIIVGASSGIGAALAQKLTDQGCHVALVARREAALRTLADALNTSAKAELASVYPHDVEETADVPALFETIVQHLGGLDLIIYASGIMPKIAPGEYSIEKDQQIIAVNLTGAVAWLNAAAQRFEKARSGTIIGISSVAGDRGRYSNTVYGASKAALNAYLESLRNRLGRHGVKVVTIKPGPVKTEMTEGLKMPLMISADQAATEILAAAQEGRRIAYVPSKWKPIMAIVRAIPSPIFQHLKF